MKLLVCGEGTSEIGRPEQQGVIETLVRRCLEANARGLTFDVVKVSQLPKDRSQAGEARRARQAIDEARRRDCDGFVYVRDADGHHAERRRQLEEAFANLDVPHVFALAVETLEAWLLSDPDAVRDVLRRRLDVPPSPESLWGRPGTAGHPKFEWNRLCRAAGYDEGLASMAAVAERLSIERARVACPQGFGRFHDQLLRAFPAFDIVVAADPSWGIGHGNTLPWPRLKGDLAHLKALYRAGRDADVDNVFVLGGAQLYRDALEHPRLRFAYMTRIAQPFECDAHIPSLDHLVPDPGWTSEASGHHEDAGIAYTIERRRRA